MACRVCIANQNQRKEKKKKKKSDNTHNDSHPPPPVTTNHHCTATTNNPRPPQLTSSFFLLLPIAPSTKLRPAHADRRSKQPLDATPVLKPPPSSSADDLPRSHHRAELTPPRLFSFLPLAGDEQATDDATPSLFSPPICGVEPDESPSPPLDAVVARLPFSCVTARVFCRLVARLDAAASPLSVASSAVKPTEVS
ncbi:hypothetical protein Tsubulata_044311 [Turnera subulata]|uniref:Uncharacterized protein n=1 Tax=Turnera subulata TaxID=218843 RepID=A0A9Q0JG90_9ROSI|nr:hypothetical protein Tsubulata_044311 [Turnera subulata]